MSVAIVEEPSLLLKVVYAVGVRRPRAVSEDDGRLNVRVPVVPVMVKSEPMVEVAMMIVGPFWVCPVGPMAVIPPNPAADKQEPLIE